jgi:hypothetical protein
MHVEIHKTGFVWRQDYNASKPGPLQKGEPTTTTGSTVQFWPDPKVFETTEFDFQTIYRRLQEYAFLNRALTINFTDLRSVDETGEHRKVSFMYKDGISDFVRHLNMTKNPIHKTVIDFGTESVDEGMAVEIAMQWNESYGESVYTFANSINTHEGGTHEEGFRAALTTIVNRYGTEKKFLKSDEKLSGEDIREGLAAIISVKLANPAVRGPDQDQARQHRHEELRAEGRERAARRLVRPQPRRRQDDHHEGVPGGPRPASPPSRPASWPGASRCWSPARCPASWPTASPPTRGSASCSSSRATRPAARPSRAATARSRRSCRSAARS